MQYFIILLVIILQQATCYNLTCLGYNKTCVPYQRGIQFLGGKNEFSHFRPESSCNSCLGVSDCNNTNPICVRRIVCLNNVRVSAINNRTLEPTNFSITFSEPENPSPLKRRPFSSSPSLKRQGTIIVKYSENTIYVTSYDQYHTMVVWSLNEFTDNFYCGDKCEFTLKPEYLIKNGMLNVKVFISDVKVFNDSFPIDSDDVCVIRNCNILCVDYFNNFVCYSPFVQGTIVISYIALLFIVIVVIYKISNSIHTKVTGRWVIGTPDSVPMATIGLIFLICISPVNGQCITSTVIYSTIETCSFVNGIDTCSFTMNQNIILPHLGNKVCISMYSPENKYLGGLNITYDLSLTQADTSPSYYTSDYDGQSCSGKSCRNSDYCSSGCTQNQATLNSYLSPNGECTLWPGRSSCQSSCGCAGCGCFICSDACLASRYSFKPKGAVIQVNEILATSLLPRLIISYEINSTLSSESLDLDEVKDIGPFKIGLIGSFAGPVAVFGNNKFVLRGSSAYLAPANSYNNPIFGFVGDIQSERNSFSSPSLNAFIYPASVVPSTVTQESVIYNFPSKGASLLNSNTILPKVLGGMTWTSSGTRLFALTNKPPAVSVFITSAPIRLSYRRTRVCPKMGKATINGCYNCPQGLTITINSLSLCEEGSVLVTFETNSRIQCFNNFIRISKVTSNSIINCVSYDKQIRMNLTLKGDTSDSIIIETVLNNPPPLTQQEIEDVYGNYTDPNNGDFLSWWDSLTGSMAFLKFLIIFGIIFATLMTIVIAAYFSYICYRKYEVYNLYQSLSYDPDDESL